MNGLQMFSNEINLILPVNVNADWLIIRVFTIFRILEISNISNVFLYFVYYSKVAAISRK